MSLTDGLLLFFIFDILFFLTITAGYEYGFKVGYFKAVDEIAELIEEVEDNE